MQRPADQAYLVGNRFVSYDSFVTFLSLVAKLLLQEREQICMRDMRRRMRVEIVFVGE